MNQNKSQYCKEKTPDTLYKIGMFACMNRESATLSGGKAQRLKGSVIIITKKHFPFNITKKI